MISKIEQLIGEIEEYVAGCKPVPFSNTKIAVNRDEFEEMIGELRLRTPDEIRKYQKLISNKDAIIAEAKEKADKMIAEASEQFGVLNGNVNELVEDIREIDAMLETLSDANNRIVDNIMQLSATTEEVTASAQQSASMSDKNKENTEKAQEVLRQVLEVAEKMDQFLLEK